MADRSVVVRLRAEIGQYQAGMAKAKQSTQEFGREINLAEFGSYWLHRLSHRGGWLWRVHLMHHRPERLNLGNALNAHPINALYDKLARIAPLLLLGFSSDAIEIATLFAITQSLVTHANIAGTIGPLNYIIGSAELHRMHHSTDPDQAGNFGTALPYWDQVFGTFRYGGAPKDVGVFDPSHYPGEHEFGALLRWPFVKDRFPQHRR